MSDDERAAAEAEEAWLEDVKKDPGMRALLDAQDAHPWLDFELDDNGDVVCTTIPN
jgi:hypothetical protein